MGSIDNLRDDPEWLARQDALRLREKRKEQRAEATTKKLPRVIQLALDAYAESYFQNDQGVGAEVGEAAAKKEKALARLRLWLVQNRL